MPIYEFRCPACTSGFQAFASAPPDLTVTPIPCPDCTTPLRRRYTPFTHRAGLPDHYNPAVGSYVRSMADLKSHFSRMSDEVSERQGHEARFVPVDLREQRAELGVTDEGLDSTYRREHDSGQAPARGAEYGRAAVHADRASTPTTTDEVRWLPKLT